MDKTEKIIIEESNLCFGKFDKKKVFEIEKSSIYKKLGPSIKICEFILLQKKNLIFLEAKSTFPNPSNKESFDEFINEISQKFNNALDIFVSGNLEILNNRNNENINLLNIQDLKNHDILFYLVINGAKIEWLQPIQDGLKAKLLPQRKIWRMQVFVMNEEVASNKKLIAKDNRFIVEK